LDQLLKTFISLSDTYDYKIIAGSRYWQQAFATAFEICRVKSAFLIPIFQIS